MSHQPETYELGKIFADVTKALLRAEVLMQSPKVKGGAKNWIKTSIVNRLKAIKNDVVTTLGSKEADMMKDDILSEDRALQIEEFENLFMALSKEDRDATETYMTELLKQSHLKQSA